MGRVFMQPEDSFCEGRHGFAVHERHTHHCPRLCLAQVPPDESGSGRCQSVHGKAAGQQCCAGSEHAAAGQQEEQQVVRGGGAHMLPHCPAQEGYFVLPGSICCTI